MTIRNLGAITKPVIICGGAYGNLEALHALANAATDRGISDSHIIHNGDIAAYCADADAASTFVRTRGWHVIKGNVEEQIAMGADDCGCGFAEGSACDLASVQWYAHVSATMSTDNRRWIAAMPGALKLVMSGHSITVVHGSVTQTNRFMFASAPDEAFAEELAVAGTACVIAGHTGVPFTRNFGDRCWINCGALGMPANDGTPRCWYVVLTPGNGTFTVEHCALDYDAHSAAQKIRSCDLPEGYADALETGLWPSLDVMPLKEQARTGKRLRESTVVWPNRIAQSA